MHAPVVARALSILGHPALLMPCAVATAAWLQGAPAPLLRVALAASLLVAGCIGAYSLLQVRAGRWHHIDASAPRERSQLNLFAVPLLLGMAAALWWSGLAPPAARGMAIGGVLVLFAHVLRGQLKTSLHAAFAAFGAALLWPHAGALVLASIFAAAVCWSRLVLARHTPAEVALGAAAGGMAGWLFQLWTHAAQ